MKICLIEILPCKYIVYYITFGIKYRDEVQRFI